MKLKASERGNERSRLFWYGLQSNKKKTQGFVPSDSWKRKTVRFFALAPCHTELQHSCLRDAFYLHSIEHSFPNTQTQAPQEQLGTAPARRSELQRRSLPGDWRQTKLTAPQCEILEGNSRRQLALGTQQHLQLEEHGQGSSSHPVNINSWRCRIRATQKAEGMTKAWHLSFSAEDCSSAGKCSRTPPSMQCLAGQNDCIHSQVSSLVEAALDWIHPNTEYRLKVQRKTTLITKSDYRQGFSNDSPA